MYGCGSRPENRIFTPAARGILHPRFRRLERHRVSPLALDDQRKVRHSSGFGLVVTCRFVLNNRAGVPRSRLDARHRNPSGREKAVDLGVVPHGTATVNRCSNPHHLHDIARFSVLEHPDDEFVEAVDQRRASVACACSLFGALTENDADQDSACKTGRMVVNDVSV